MTDAGRHIQVSIWLSVYEYTPLERAVGKLSVFSNILPRDKTDSVFIASSGLVAVQL
jgi:hypothetical protein